MMDFHFLLILFKLELHVGQTTVIKFSGFSKRAILESRFANVKISSRSLEKVDFRFGYFIESYAKLQGFR